MKKVNNKKKYALLSAYLLTLGLVDKRNKKENSNEIEKHYHLYVNVGDTTIVFKECEGYNLILYPLANKSAIRYEIYDEQRDKIMEGYSSDYYAVETDHTHTDDMEEFIMSNTENVKVYTLNK